MARKPICRRAGRFLKRLPMEKSRVLSIRRFHTLRRLLEPALDLFNTFEQ
jgi:hypothetical protein